MDRVSRGNLSWPRRNYFTKVNDSEKVMKMRNLILWQAMGGSTISCVVMVFRYIVTGQQDPERLIDKLIVYILHARKLSIKYKYPPSSIIAIDETSALNSMVSNTTIHKQGVRSVCLKTTGHEE